jgi:hypothetical protein
MIKHVCQEGTDAIVLFIEALFQILTPNVQHHSFLPTFKSYSHQSVVLYLF